MSTSEPYPLYNAFRGTLVLEVNFTGQGNPCQKCLWGRLGRLVKFTFRADPRQKALRGPKTPLPKPLQLPLSNRQATLPIISVFLASDGCGEACV